MDSFVHLVTLPVFFPSEFLELSSVTFMLLFPGLFTHMPYLRFHHSLQRRRLQKHASSTTTSWDFFFFFTFWGSSVFLKLQSPHQWRASFSSSPARPRFTLSHLFTGLYLTASLILLTDEGLHSSQPFSVILTSHSL